MTEGFFYYHYYYFDKVKALFPVYFGKTKQENNLGWNEQCSFNSTCFYTVFLFFFLPENDFCLKTVQGSSEWDFIEVDNVSVLNYFQFGFSIEPFRFQIHVFIKTIYVRNVFNLSLESQLAMKTDLMQLTEKVNYSLVVLNASKMIPYAFLNFKCDYLSEELLRCTNLFFMI